MSDIAFSRPRTFEPDEPNLFANTLFFCQLTFRYILLLIYLKLSS